MSSKYFPTIIITDPKPTLMQVWYPDQETLFMQICNENLIDYLVPLGWVPTKVYNPNLYLTQPQELAEFLKDVSEFYTAP